MASREHNAEMESVHRQMKRATARLISGDQKSASEIHELSTRHRKLLLNLPPVPRRKLR